MFCVDDKPYALNRTKFIQASTADEKARTLATLAYAPTRALIGDALEFALSPAVRSQDAAGLLAGLAAQGGASLDDTWHFVKRCVMNPRTPFFLFDVARYLWVAFGSWLCLNSVPQRLCF